MLCEYTTIYNMYIFVFCSSFVLGFLWVILFPSLLYVLLHIDICILYMCVCVCVYSSCMCMSSSAVCVLFYWFHQPKIVINFKRTQQTQEFENNFLLNLALTICLIIYYSQVRNLCTRQINMFYTLIVILPRLLLVYVCVCVCHGWQCTKYETTHGQCYLVVTPPVQKFANVPASNVSTTAAFTDKRHNLRKRQSYVCSHRSKCQLTINITQQQAHWFHEYQPKNDKFADIFCIGICVDDAPNIVSSWYWLISFRFVSNMPDWH